MGTERRRSLRTASLWSVVCTAFFPSIITNTYSRLLMLQQRSSAMMHWKCTLCHFSNNTTLCWFRLRVSCRVLDVSELWKARSYRVSVPFVHRYACLSKVKYTSVSSTDTEYIATGQVRIYSYRRTAEYESVQNRHRAADRYVRSYQNVSSPNRE